MKFGVMFSNTGYFSEPEHCEVLVKTAEEVGIESLWTVEHVVIPTVYQSIYPYSRRGKLPGGVNNVTDPIVWMSFVAAMTKTIRLATGILILPQRHPTYVAKEFATLDRLSQGRAIMGIGIGWLEEEFAAVGIPFKTRAARTDASIEAVRDLWSSGPSTLQNDFFRWESVESNPKPVQENGVPIVIGGHASAAAKRAARLGDGFFPGRIDKLDELLKIMKAECAAIGRDPKEIEITTGTPDMSIRNIETMAEKGVSRLTIPLPGRDKEEVRKGLEHFANNVLAKI